MLTRGYCPRKAGAGRMSRVLPVAVIREHSKGERIELGQISRYSCSRARPGSLEWFLKPRLGTWSALVSSTASSRPLVVRLWWMCEDNQCKIFTTKEEVRGMGREQRILTTHRRPRSPVNSLFSSISHRATGLISFEERMAAGRYVTSQEHILPPQCEPK